MLLKCAICQSMGKEFATIDIQKMPNANMRAQYANFAEVAGTIPYEILTGLNERIPRVYR